MPTYVPPPVTAVTTSQRIASAWSSNALLFDTNLGQYFMGDGVTLGGVPSTYTTNKNTQPRAAGVVCRTFGDSVTNNTGASPASNSWANLVCTANGWTRTDLSASGAQIPDQAPLVYAETPAEGANYTLGLGTNDQFSYQNQSGRLDLFLKGYAALAAYLAIPNTSPNKFLANSGKVTYTGTWSSSASTFSPYWSFGQVSTTNGSTATATVAGRCVYVATTVSNGNGGTFTVSIDGVLQVNPVTNSTTFSCVGQSTVTVKSGLITWAPYLLRFPGLSNGTHTVVITVTSATGSGSQVFLDWVAGTGPRYTDGPFLYCMGLARCSSTVYTNASTTERVTQIYSDALVDISQKLASDGLPLTFCDPLALIDPNTETIDGLHPNNAGHAKMAGQLLHQTNANAYPSDRIGSQPLGVLGGLINLDWNSKYVGIGTAYPTTELEIIGTSGSLPSPQIRLTGPNIVGHAQGIYCSTQVNGSRIPAGFFGCTVKSGGGGGHFVFNSVASGQASTEMLHINSDTKTIGILGASAAVNHGQRVLL